jgi:hypothetical protein
VKLRFSKPRRSLALACALYVLLAIVSYYPQSLRPWDTIGYIGDSLESVYIIAWNVHQVFGDPLHLFDANILYPHKRSLTFTDHQLLPSLAVAPVVWLARNPVLAYNVAVLLAALLAAFAARRLAEVLGAGAIGAWTAGALYAFHTYQVNEASRIQTIFHGFMILALAELLIYLRTGARRAGLRLGLFMLLQALCSNYHLLYGCVLLGAVTLAFLAARPRETWRRLPLLAVVGLTAGLLYLPIGLPYVLSSETHGYAREAPIGIDLAHYFSTSPTNVWYGPIGVKVKLQLRGPHFVGFITLALALGSLAGWLWRRRRAGAESDDPPAALPGRVWIPAAALMTLAIVALSLGRDMEILGHGVGPGPYRLLHAYLPGFHLMRFPERLGLIVMAFLGALVADALTRLGRRGLTGVVLLLAAAVPLEHLSPIRHLDRIPVAQDVPTVYRWLATHEVKALAEVPIHGEALVRMESLEMYFSTFHFKPIVHGYASYPTPLNRFLRRASATFPSETALQVFQRIGVDTVVVHFGRPDGADIRQQPERAPVEAQLRPLITAAGLDTFDQLPGAVAAGRIQRLARFTEPPDRVQQGQVDEVYRVLPSAPAPGAPFPDGRRVSEARWRYSAPRGLSPERLGDGDRGTSWLIDDALAGDEWVAIHFDRPTTICGVVLPLNWDSVLPTRFAVEGLIASHDDPGAAERWRPLARYTRAHALQLLDRLLATPRDAALGFAFPAQEVHGVRLSVEPGGTSFEGWKMPEVEIRVP